MELLLGILIFVIVLGFAFIGILISDVDHQVSVIFDTIARIEKVMALDEDVRVMGEKIAQNNDRKYIHLIQTMGKLNEKTLASIEDLKKKPKKGAK
jgi:hypothetical protein